MRGIDLRGRMAIVTGAGRGIGAAIVRGLDAAGARVALVARTESELRGVAATLGNDPVVVPADLGTVEGPAPRRPRPSTPSPGASTCWSITSAPCCARAATPLPWRGLTYSGASTCAPRSS